jgi:hypothetical protein
MAKAKAKATERPAAKRPVGRPSLYRREYCDQVIEMGKQGYSLASMASLLDVDKATIIRWRDEHEEFRTALSKAMIHSQHWWESAGVMGMMKGGKNFNALVWKVSMQARFRDDYTERKVQEVSGPGGGPIETKTDQRVSLDAEKLTPEEREVLRAALLKAKRGDK